jgi:hypothetical protein
MRPLTSVALAAMLVTGCDTSTEPTVAEVEIHRAAWAAQGIDAYQAVFEMDGSTAIARRAWRLEVIGNVVRTAVDVETGVAVDPAGSGFLTVDALFDRALTAAHSGRLLAIRYDPTYHYPTLVRVTANPDAVGTIELQSLTPTGSR